jgi:hypothetical protein
VTATKLIRVAEPQLAFRYGQTAEHPRDGLFLFGPIDDRQHPPQLRYGIIGPALAVARFKAWAERARGPLPPADAGKAHHTAWPGFDAAFRCEWPGEPMAEIVVSSQALSDAIHIGDRHEAIYRTVSLYEKPIIDYLAVNEARPALWFVIIPEEVYKLGRPMSDVKRGERTPSQIKGQLPGKPKRVSGQIALFGEDREADDMRRYAKHFRNQLKARLLRHLVAIQVVRETTTAPNDFLNQFGKPIRGVQDPTTVTWNLCTTAFFKGEGKPWRLASIREGVCYIGLVFKRDPTGDRDLYACCGAQMFLNSGDGVVFRGAFGNWWKREQREYHLDDAAAKDLVERVVIEYRRQHGDQPPKELFIHGRAAFTDEEWKGFNAAVDDRTNLVGVRIRQSRDLKLFADGGMPVMRGLAYPISATRAYLWTTGYVPRLDTYPGWEVPNPLAVDVLRGEAPLETVLADVMALTKLNYNSADYSATLPVTLGFADAVGEILMAAPEDGPPVPPLPFRYYI